MPAKIFWIEGPWRGHLAIVPRPRGGDWLCDDLAAWRDAGIDVVVSLLEPQEEAQLDLSDEAAAAQKNGIEYKSFPFPDRSVPPSRDSARTLASGIVDALNAGRNVGVHCRQSIGRSALIAGSVLITAGKNPVTALEAVNAARGVPVPETEEQRRWLDDFALVATRVPLYYFRKHDINTDEWPQSRRPATMETIDKLGGTPVTETEFKVDLDQIDEDGFLKVDEASTSPAKDRPDGR